MDEILITQKFADFQRKANRPLEIFEDGFANPFQGTLEVHINLYWEED